MGSTRIQLWKLTGSTWNLKPQVSKVFEASQGRLVLEAKISFTTMTHNCPTMVRSSLHQLLKKGFQGRETKSPRNNRGIYRAWSDALVIITDCTICTNGCLIQTVDRWWPKTLPGSTIHPIHQIYVLKLHDYEQKQSYCLTKTISNVK